MEVEGWTEGAAEAEEMGRVRRRDALPPAGVSAEEAAAFTSSTMAARRINWWWVLLTEGGNSSREAWEEAELEGTSALAAAARAAAAGGLDVRRHGRSLSASSARMVDGSAYGLYPPSPRAPATFALEKSFRSTHQHRGRVLALV